MKKIVGLAALTAVAMLLCSYSAMAQWQHGGGGSRGGWGGGGGGGGESWGGGRSSSSAPSHSAPASRTVSPGHAYGHSVHPVGPMAYHHGDYGHWYHGDWHDHYHWGHPWHYGPVGWFSVGVGFGIVTAAVVWDTPWRWGYWSYYNPYYCPVVVVGEPVYDYSQPIAVARAPNIDPALAEQRASQYLDAAHDAFARGDYATAMAQANGAIAVKPNDTVPHEVRALILFAMRRYKESAGAVYAVLSVGPGWDWATLAGMYPDINLYTAQLRGLEQYRNDHPNVPELHFLLAYHYMSCGHVDAAIAELRDTVRLSPRDQLSAQLLTGLMQQQNPADTKPSLTTTAPAAPSVPVTTAGLEGTWAATRADGASFSLEIAKDGTYSWRHTMQGQSQNFSGGYTVADNLLILKQGGNPAMIGQIIQTDADHFNFKMAGNNPADPGLTFTRR